LPKLMNTLPDHGPKQPKNVNYFCNLKNSTKLTLGQNSPNLVTLIGMPQEAELLIPSICNEFSSVPRVPVYVCTSVSVKGGPDWVVL
jgi:hypothetical protein